VSGECESNDDENSQNRGCRHKGIEEQAEIGVAAGAAGVGVTEIRVSESIAVPTTEAFGSSGITEAGGKRGDGWKPKHGSFCVPDNVWVFLKLHEYYLESSTEVVSAVPLE